MPVLPGSFGVDRNLPPPSKLNRCRRNVDMAEKVTYWVGIIARRVHGPYHLRTAGFSVEASRWEDAGSSSQTHDAIDRLVSPAERQEWSIEIRVYVANPEKNGGDGIACGVLDGAI